MTAILELPEVRQRVSPLSVEEYSRLDEYNENGKRTELIRGIVIEKMSKSPLHTSIAMRLLELIPPLLPPGFHTRPDQPLELVDSVPEPDFAVVRGRRQDFLTSHPKSATLVVEVAVSSVALDRELASVYAEAGVEEYWIILAADRAVEIHRKPAGGTYREKIVVTAGEQLHCTSVPGLSFPAEEIFT